MEMTREHWIELMNDPEARLTQVEMDHGYHWCLGGWDGLLIGPPDEEWRFCECGAREAYEQKNHRHDKGEPVRTAQGREDG